MVWCGDAQGLTRKVPERRYTVQNFNRKVTGGLPPEKNDQKIVPQTTCLCKLWFVGCDPFCGLARIERVCFITLRRPGTVCVPRLGFCETNGVATLRLRSCDSFLYYCQGKTKCSAKKLSLCVMWASHTVILESFGKTISFKKHKKRVDHHLN